MQTDINVEALIYAIIGALIGTVGSISTVLIHTRAQSKRDRLSLVKDLALSELKLSFDMAVKSEKSFSASFVIYLYYYSEFVRMMESGKFNENKMVELQRKVDALERKVSPR